MVAMGQRSRAPMGQRSRVCLLSLKLLPMKARDVTMMARPARAQIKGMKDRDLARLWAQYVRELAVLLVRAEGGDPTPEVAARVQELVHRELLLLYIRCARTLCMFPMRNKAPLPVL